MDTSTTLIRSAIDYFLGQIPRINLDMYCIERQIAGCRWRREMSFKTEFKALVNARSKAIETLATYRVVHATWANQVVAEVNGHELIKIQAKRR